MISPCYYFCSAKTSKFEGTSGCSYSFIIQKEPFIKWMAATRIANQLNTLEKMDGCKCLFQKNRVPLKILDHCKWFPEIMAVLLKCITASAPLKQQHALNRNICQIHCIYTFMVASALLQNTVSIEEWLAATTFVK